MNTTRTILTALTLGVILSTHAFTQQVWNEQRITNTSWEEGGPVVWGDTVYYSANTSGSWGIYAWDAASGSRPVVQTAATEALEAVYADKIVYTVYSGGAGTADLYLFDPVNGRRAISTALGDQKRAQIYGDKVVWQDYRSGRPQIYMWDPVNGERPLLPSSSRQENPRISQSRVVWDDDQYGTYMWTPEGGAVNLGGGVSPAVYEDKVVNWTLGHYEFDNGYYLIPGYLWEWTPSTGWQTLAEHPFTEWSEVQYTKVWGDLVTWQRGIDLATVNAWDPLHGFSRVGAGFTPSVYENRIAWSSWNWDVYLSTMVPEPSSLLALAGGIGFLLLRQRRKMRR